MTTDPDRLLRLDGRVALVTGASYGLGVLFADVLARAGADVAVMARSADKLADTRKLVEAHGRRCVAVEGDVTSYADCEAAAAACVNELGTIDVLVNNAGWADDRLMRTEHVDPESFARMVQVDLVGLFYMTRAAAPTMLAAGRGSIINLSSIFGMAGSENRTAGYFAAKGGVNQLTRQLACEWGDRNVRVNALAPNFFISEMTRTLLEDSGMATWMRSRTPMRRLGELDELVGPLLFLASDASSFVTGHVLTVDGGWSASGGYAQLPQPWDEWNGEAGTPIGPVTVP
ncbi:SDR family NAD(P)-dependent oxidoreductase [Desertimonas flava]|jgi:gluconate 5-dehydrogenase|uniref:SDR family NAD(P)-dependent oxidoreductase n=1 Tax=Desertimonas flava TaxID=2064846 RepID=UPI000E34C62A|nr:glucose 1-dehydrogenase [Desertimonas flava]